MIEHGERRVKRGMGALALVAVVLAACDPGAYDAGAPSVCREAGEQCALAKGPLGVCERAVCAEGDPGPCFMCAPQH